MKSLGFAFYLLLHQLDITRGASIVCSDRLNYNPKSELCCLGEVFQITGDKVQCCGQNVFDSSTEICCEGRIYPNTEGLTQCCGHQPYDPTSATCCSENRGRSTVHFEVGTCCRDKGVYDPNSELCCYSYLEDAAKIHQLLGAADWRECCGSELYDSRYETCSNENILTGFWEFCGSELFEPSKEFCCNGRIYKEAKNATIGCCGDLPYNTSSSTCCSGRLHDVVGGSCCWGEAYDPATSSCCDYVVDNSLPEVPGVQSCCGSRSYLTSEEICCSGQLFSRGEHTECCGNGVYDTRSQLCCGDWFDRVVNEKKSNRTSCCRENTYEKETETCCHRTGAVFPVPDGHCCMMGRRQEGAFDPNMGICCSTMFDEIFYPGYSTYEHECCGTYLVGKNQLCDWANGIPIVKSSHNHDVVCPGITPEESVTFNSLSSICVHGRVVPLDGFTTVCGNQIMDEVTEICCSDAVIHSRFDVERNERRCCDDSMLAYSPSSEMCCGGMIYGIPESEGSCCEYQAYRTSVEVCEDDGFVRPAGKPLRCGEQFYSEDEQGCCGGLELFGRGFTCCDGRVYSTMTEGINKGLCCGGIGYNPENSTCCGGNLYQKQPNDVECCGDKLFPPESQRHHVCCDGIQQSTHDGRTECQGSLPYNPDRETVCGDVRYPVPDATCCGSALFDADVALCCQDNVILKNGLDSLSCCGREAYNTLDPSVLCCEGVFHQDAEGMACCGSHIYDPSTQQCCGGGHHTQFIYNRQDHFECCGTILYNSSKHQCCDRTLHKFRAGLQCCGGEVMLDAGSICCGGNLDTKQYGDYTQCCGMKIYDETAQVCLSGDVVGNRSNEKCLSNQANCCDGQLLDGSLQGCCQGIVFNRESQTCCSGKLHPLQRGTVCCDENLYETDRQICCGGQIHNLTQTVNGCQDLMAPVVCMEPSMAEALDLLGMLDRYRLVFLISLKRSPRFCRFRILEVVQYPSGYEGVVGTSLSFSEECPCPGMKRKAVLFTNQDIVGEHFHLSTEDILMESNKKLRQRLKLMSRQF